MPPHSRKRPSTSRRHPASRRPSMRRRETARVSGRVCLGTASFLAFTATILMIFVHVGQINTSNVPRGISMAKVNTSGYGTALAAATLDEVVGLYTNNASKPLGLGLGLRQIYQFGLYTYCAYVDTKNGTCSNSTVARRFQPYDDLVSDMNPNFAQLTSNIILDTTFRSSNYLGSSSRSAYYLLLLGTICAGFALLLGFIKHTVTFVVSTVFAILGSIFLLVGAAIWTVLIKKSEALNDFIIGPNAAPAPLGIVVSVGPALFMTWAAFACLTVSTGPYMVSCCTYRG